MIWRYDEAIVDDLNKSFNTDSGTNKPVVAVVPPDDVISIAAQIQDDKITFPIIAVTRERNIALDGGLTNFTRQHLGVNTVFDPKTNMEYYEKAVPIDLSYTLVAMSTNTVDVDEIIRELIFKYTNQYFLSIHVPYESKRRIRFGVTLDKSQGVEWYSAASEYLNEGKLNSAGIRLVVDGAVLLTYTPVHLKRFTHEVEIFDK